MCSCQSQAYNTIEAVEDTISDKCRTKIFNIRRGSREKLFEIVANVFSHEIWALKLQWPWHFPILKMENFKSYVDVSHKHKTPSKPSVCTFKMSSTLTFEFFKKASSIALTRRWLELKQIICLMLQSVLTKHGIYTWKKVIWRKAVINKFFWIYQNEYTKHYSQLN